MNVSTRTPHKAFRHDRFHPLFFQHTYRSRLKVVYCLVPPLCTQVISVAEMVVCAPMALKEVKEKNMAEMEGITSNNIKEREVTMKECEGI